MSSLNNTAATAPTKINDPISLKFPYYYHYSPIDSVYRWHDKQYGYSQPTYRYEPGFGSDAIGFGSYTRDKAWPKTTLSFGEGNIADAVFTRSGWDLPVGVRTASAMYTSRPVDANGPVTVRPIRSPSRRRPAVPAR